jgi:hypothetical protein
LALFIQADRGVFLLVAFGTGCWTVINEGDAMRGGYVGWWSTMIGDLLPLAAMAMLLSLAPDKSVPSWVFVKKHQLIQDHSFWKDSFPRMPISWCGAILGHLIRKRLMATVGTRR